MVLVTCGHEKGIGLEVFVKSFVMLSKKRQAKILLIVVKEDLEKILKIMNLPFSYSKSKVSIGQSILNCHFLDEIKPNETPTMKALLYALNIKRQRDIIVTLPSSKDQFLYKKKIFSGHTEFFRTYFKEKNLAMNFIGAKVNFLLLTDHMALKDVPKLKAKEIINKVHHSLLGYKKYFNKIRTVYFAGINPHAGEKGLIGKEDHQIEIAIKKLKEKHKGIEFLGPLAADGMHYHFNSENSLFVYPYHDQGLTLFKHMHRTLGANVTFGLPFMRLSVDHGTAFHLYGRNKADMLGQLYVLTLATSV